MHLNNYPYFNKLSTINKIIINTPYNIRSYEYIPLMENLLSSLNNKELDIENMLKVTAIILFLQPFYDGNTRTLKLYMHKYLLKFGLNISWDNNVIPIFFDIDEEVSKKDLINFKKRLNIKC